MKKKKMSLSPNEQARQEIAGIRTAFDPRTIVMADLHRKETESERKTQTKRNW